MMAMTQKSQAEILAHIPPHIKVSIALNCWTSPMMQAFLTVTAYFLTDDFKYQEVLLGFENILGSHEGRYLADIAMRVLRRHELLYRVLASTTDNATNNSTLMDSLKHRLNEGLDRSHSAMSTIFDPEILKIVESPVRMPCLAHVIQLSVHALLDVIRVTARNDEIETYWNDEEDVSFSAFIEGLSSTLEKICYHSYCT